MLIIYTVRDNRYVTCKAYLSDDSISISFNDDYWLVIEKGKVSYYNPYILFDYPTTMSLENIIWELRTTEIGNNIIELIKDFKNKHIRRR